MTAVIARRHVGHFAYSFQDHTDTEPLHYLVDGKWIDGQTSIGTEIATL